MNKQNVILKTHELEVIGCGGMVEQPTQIGEWWVMPASQYTGTIPPEIMQKWDAFKAQGISVVGYLIADDMREELMRRETNAQKQQVKEETIDQAVSVIGVVAKVVGQVLLVTGVIVGAVIAGLGLGVVEVAKTVLFDPMLIAVLPDGRWVCIGAWWN